MRKEKLIAKWMKLITSRLFAVGILIALQLLLILAAVMQFARYYLLFDLVSTVIALAFVLHIIRTSRSMAYKLAWIVLILILPAFGAAVYLIFCGSRLSKESRRAMERTDDARRIPMPEREIPYDPQAGYLLNAAGCPLYTDTETRYYPSGEEFFGALTRELKTARKYIFLEYFIIADGEMWSEIREILARKAADGVDVRVIADDFGCIRRLSRRFPEQMKRDGIRAAVFHRFIPVLSALQNNRDHRKICVIDGRTAFTGGINLADEYINRTSRFGHWKDSAVMLKGPAVHSFTVMFLRMWDYITGESSGEFPPASTEHDASGTVQPYCDSPLDDEAVGENVYLGVIGEAKERLWIMTPYLILSEAMERALIRAAKSGVDVRVITPGIPDKKLVFETTRANYPALLSGGVRIWEYTPGFLHAKTVLADDSVGVVGTVNLDYRSLYLHFECGVRMKDTDAVGEIRRDFLRTFEVSREITEMKPGFFRRILHAVLQLLSPLF